MLLICNTYSSKAVDWWFFPDTDEAKTGVFVGGVMLEEYESRARIDFTKHNLIISNIQRNDVGKYTCAEDGGQGKKYNVRLEVSRE